MKRAGARSLTLALVLAATVARAETDSRDPSQVAPLVWLGDVALEEGRVEPLGVEAIVDEDRRTLHMRARFALTAAPGAHALELSAPPTGVTAFLDGTPLPLDRSDGACRAGPALVDGIDPTSGAHYALTPSSPARCERKRARVTLAPGATAELLLAATVDGGYDRLRRRRTLPEVAHMLARRTDYLVYHFAIAGAGGPAHLLLAPRTDGTLAQEQGLVRVSATEQRHTPVGVIVSVGVVVAPDVRVMARATLDYLLSWGDAVALGVDGDSSLRASLSLGYQLHTRWIPHAPFGAHLEVGPVLDVTPTARVGLRAALASHLNWSQTALLGDWFPADGTWRLCLVTGLGF